MTFGLKYLLKDSFTICKSGTDKWDINYFTLSFKGDAKKYEQKFEEEHFHSFITPLRLTIILGALFFGVFAMLDHIYYPELAHVLYVIRFGILIPVLVIVFALSFTVFFRKYLQLIAAISVYISAAGIIAMTVLAYRETNDFSYYIGIILVLFFSYSFTRLRFIYGFFAGWAIIITYEIGAVYIAHLPFNVLLNNNFFFISANIIGMLTSYYLEFSTRYNFYLQVQLQKEREKAMEVNNTLEERVKLRTNELTEANEKLKNEIAASNKYKKENLRLESQLFQLQKMETIGTLAGGIAHDFNNILTPIIGYAGMTLDELPPQNPIREDIEQIRSAAMQGKKIVQQILTFSRQIDFDKKPLRLCEVINEAVDLIKVSISQDIKIIKEFDPDCGDVLADKTQMHQVVMNLAVNSYHAMKNSGGILKFRLYRSYLQNDDVKIYKNLKDGFYVILTVSDTGHGMDKNTLNRIFEPFFTNKEVGEGTGLGLSVVHGIIKNHNGFIQIESEPGKGSTFRIFLPEYVKEKAEIKN